MNRPDFLSESLDHWRYIRTGLIAEVDNIPDERIDFRPTPDVRSVHELVQHILEGSMVMVGELTREPSDFQRQSMADFYREYGGRAREAQGKTELLDLLATQLEEGITQFQAAGEQWMRGPVTNFDGSTWYRLQWFFHGMTEEMYHRGQIVTYARLLGLVPALTQRIEASRE